MNMRFLQQLDHVAEAFRDQCDRRKLWLLGGFSLLYLVGTGLLSARKLMWNDELFTFYIARLPSLADMWSALLTGADQIPPFFHLITRASFSLFGVNHVAVRLPEVVGFWVMSLCLFRVVSKRSAALYGFVAMLFPLVTTAYDYAYEARPYGLVLGFGGLSLLCWQAAAEGHYRKLPLLGLALSLAAAVSSHYYAVVLFLPLAVGEVVRSLSRRRLDRPMWGAFGAALLPLLLFLPLIERSRTYAATFWGKPHWESIPGFYYFLLTPALMPVLATLMVSTVYVTPQLMGPGQRNPASRYTPPLHEMAAAFGFVALPVVSVILAKLVTGAFTHRYVLPSVIGFSILLAFAAYRLLDGRAITGTALVLFLCGGFVMMQVKCLEQMQVIALDQAQTYKFLRSESDSSLPIVAADAHTFMMLAHYAPRDIAARLVYLADPEAALRYLNYTTVDQGLLDLKPWFPLRVEEYDPYIASQPRFLLYVNIRYLIGNIGLVFSRSFLGYGNLSWLLSKLTASDVQIELRGRNEDKLLFLISPKEESKDLQYSISKKSS